MLHILPFSTAVLLKKQGHVDTISKEFGLNVEKKLLLQDPVMYPVKSFIYTEQNLKFTLKGSKSSTNPISRVFICLKITFEFFVCITKQYCIIDITLQ